MMWVGGVVGDRRIAFLVWKPALLLRVYPYYYAACTQARSRAQYVRSEPSLCARHFDRGFIAICHQSTNPTSMTWLRARTKPSKTNQPLQPKTLDLHSWLLHKAGISEERLPSLLALLEQHWVSDVPSLCRSIQALEKHLPAAAFTSINQAILMHPPTGAEFGGAQWASASIADTTSDNDAAFTANNTAAAVAALNAAPGGMYSSPVKFGCGESMGFATEPMSSNRMPRRLQTGAASSPATIANSLQKQQQQWPGPPPPYASPAAVASAARFLAERAKVSSSSPHKFGTVGGGGGGGAAGTAYMTTNDLNAAKSAAFRKAVMSQKRFIRLATLRALHPEGMLARFWDEWLLSFIVALVVVAMPVDLAFAKPRAGAEQYDSLWFVNRLIEVVYSADVFFRLCLAYRESPEKGSKWVFSRPKIFWRYFTTWMLLDVLAAVPIELGLWGVRRLVLGSYFTAEDGFSPLENLLRLNRLLKLLRPGHVHTWLNPPRPTKRPPKPPPPLEIVARGGPPSQQKNPRRQRFMKLFRVPALPLFARAMLKLLLCSLLLSHWLACGWVYAGMRSADAVIAMTIPAPPPPYPPPWLSHPSPPAPPLPPSPLAPPPGIEPDGIPMLRAACWLAKHGLLSEAIFGTPATLAPSIDIYTSAWLAAVASLFGIDAGAPTPAGWSEHFAMSLLIIIGGTSRLLGLSFLCAVLAAASPRDARYRKTFSELHQFCREKSLPSALSRRLQGFFRHSERLEAATRYDLLLSRMSGKLRADTAGAMAPKLLASVPYLYPPKSQIAIKATPDEWDPYANNGVEAPAASADQQFVASGASLLSLPPTPPEARYLASVVLALEPRLQCPREFIPTDRLTIFERGTAARRGRILTVGSCAGEDMIISKPELRDTEPAIALGFCQLLTIDRESLLELARPHTQACAHIRHHAIKMALRRAFIAAAHTRASQQGLVRHHGIFDEWRPPAPMYGEYIFGTPSQQDHQAAVAATAIVPSTEAEVSRRLNEMCVAMEAVNARLAALAAEMTLSSRSSHRRCKSPSSRH